MVEKYKGGVRMHKMVYEAYVRLIWKGLLEFDLKGPVLSDDIKMLSEKFHKTTKQEDLDGALA